MDSNKFIQSVVAVVIGVIVAVSVAVPIVSGLTLGTDDTFANKSIVNTMIGIIPVFIIIALLIGAVAIMKSRRD